MRNIHILAIPCNSQSFFLCAFTFSADFSALVKILKLEVRAHVFPEELCAGDVWTTVQTNLARRLQTPRFHPGARHVNTTRSCSFLKDLWAHPKRCLAISRSYEPDLGNLGKARTMAASRTAARGTASTLSKVPLPHGMPGDRFSSVWWSLARRRSLPTS